MAALTAMHLKGGKIVSELMRPNCMHFILFVVICMLLGNMCWYFMCDRRQFLLFCTPVWLFVCPSICTIVWAQV